jgi:hypothetical protein
MTTLSFAREARLRDLAHHAALGRFPVRGTEAAAHRQGPAIAQGGGVEGGTVLVEGDEAAQLEVDVADRHRLARIDHHAGDRRAA